jgi:hypothetical protein
MEKIVTEHEVNSAVILDKIMKTKPKVYREVVKPKVGCRLFHKASKTIHPTIKGKFLYVCEKCTVVWPRYN